MCNLSMVKLIARDLEFKRAILLAKRKPIAAAWQAWHKFREFLLADYKFMDGKSFYPSNITYEIHHGCNLTCKTCWFYGTSGMYTNNRGGTPKPLDLEKIKEFIDNVSSFKPYFLLTGGEVGNRLFIHI